MLDVEADLVRKTVAGDRAALARLLALAGPDVRRGLKNAFHWNPDLELDDVMQITYLEACQRISSFQPRGQGAFVAWLNRIARNNLTDAIRGLSRQKRTPPGQRIVAQDAVGSSVALLDRLAITSTTPSRHATRAEVHSAVQAAIKDLPKPYAEVILLLDIQGHSTADTATAMKRSRGAIYILHRRALDSLRERLMASPIELDHAS